MPALCWPSHHTRAWRILSYLASQGRHQNVEQRRQFGAERPEVAAGKCAAVMLIVIRSIVPDMLVITQEILFEVLKCSMLESMHAAAGQQYSKQ